MNSLPTNIFLEKPAAKKENENLNIFFSNDTMESMARHFVGNNYRYREQIIVPQNVFPVKVKTNEEKLIERVFDSCGFKSFMACVLGYGLGAAIGLFSSSVNPNLATPGVEKQQTAREILREMRMTTHSYAKNFAVIGLVFSAVECTIESVSY